MVMPAVVRCYWGAYDSASQAALDAQDKALRIIKTKEPEAHVTYFPVEHEYQVHAWGRPLSGFHSTRAAALWDALERLNLTQEE